METERVQMKILVTGGAGYIGSHTIVELLAAGHEAVAVDDLCNSDREALRRVERITGQPVPFYEADIRDREGLEWVFREHRFDCCIHFAGLKAVGESVRKPWEYYENNIYGTLVLTDVMRKHGCKNIVFSSSATVYGEPASCPVSEESPKGRCENPYGRTKSMLEDILADLHTADELNEDPQPWNVVLLRYFNPIGAHPSGLIGEDPSGIPNNLMPYITRVAVGKLEKLHVFGNDYDTPDGTGVRDFIHVVDLARGHVKALQAIERNCGVAVYNLGTGKGCSVMEVLRAFEEASGVKIPYVIDPRRPGDLASIYSDPGKANRELGWRAEYDLGDMCRDSWNWQKHNPNGYASESGERSKA
jgi:UDP-glucose 4-epimerase